MGDSVRHVGGVEVHLEIKTKLLGRASSPKGFNVDKALRLLAEGKSALVYWFVGLDLLSEEVTTSIVSIFDTTVLDATKFRVTGPVESLAELRS